MSIGTVARQRRKARQGRLNAQATSFTLRHEPGVRDPLEWDMRVLYPQPVAGATREIDTQEWSRVILELLETEARGNRSELARLIGVDYQTIRRWIMGSHKVSEENVRAVARAFKLSAIDLLIRVGYYLADEMVWEAGPPDVRPVDDKPSAIIDAADVRPSVKRELHEYVAKKRAEYEQILVNDVVRWIELERKARRSA